MAAWIDFHERYHVGEVLPDEDEKKPLGALIAISTAVGDRRAVEPLDSAGGGVRRGTADEVTAAWIVVDTDHRLKQRATMVQTLACTLLAVAASAAEPSTEAAPQSPRPHQGRPSFSRLHALRLRRGEPLSARTPRTTGHWPRRETGRQVRHRLLGLQPLPFQARVPAVHAGLRAGNVLRFLPERRWADG
jgi:hypothetical protein